MNHEELEDIYLEWIKKEYNNEFKDGVPGMVDLIIKEMIEHDKKEGIITSESLGDYSVSFASSGGDYPLNLTRKLETYRMEKVNRIRFV